MNAEPVLILALARAAIHCGIVFGLTLDADQKLALMGLVEAVAALYTRSRVSPFKEKHADDF